MRPVFEKRLLAFHPDTMETVLSSCNLHRPGEMSNAIDILDEWIKQQNHFTKKNFSRDYLMILIINAKGSVERAKLRLDKTLTYKTMMPQYYGCYDLRNDFMELDGRMQYGFMPNLTGNHHRLWVIKSYVKKIESTIGLHFARCVFMIGEYLKAEDYSGGLILFVDNRGENLMDIIANVNIAEVQQITTIILAAGHRIKGLHFLTSPSVIMETMFKFLFQFAPEKLKQRIKMHTTLESVHKDLPKKILPKEYGGEEKSLAEFHEDLVELTRSKDFKEHLTEMSEARTDESLRPADSFNDLYMGTPGTFRTLNVD